MFDIIHIIYYIGTILQLFGEVISKTSNRNLNFRELHFILLNHPTYRVIQLLCYNDFII